MQRFLLSVALLLFCPFVTHAQCPPDTVYCFGAPTESHESGYSCIGTWTAAQSCFGACYDLSAGEIGVLSGGIPISWTYGVSVEDEYWLTGPASPSPLFFFARLHLTETTEAGTQGQLRFGEIGGVEHIGTLGGGATLDAYYFVPLSHSPGEKFRIHARIWITSLGAPSADLRARLEFVDVPVGWTVASCQGYNLPTPTAVSTWGQVKARYR